jgi:hypothetical protein
MNTKLYLYKIRFFENENSEFSFYALADNEYEAQSLILEKVENEIYKNELIKIFKEKNFTPKVYEKNEVFIQHQGELPIFS